MTNYEDKDTKALIVSFQQDVLPDADLKDVLKKKGLWYVTKLIDGCCKLDLDKNSRAD